MHESRASRDHPHHDGSNEVAPLLGTSSVGVGRRARVTAASSPRAVQRMTAVCMNSLGSGQPSSWSRTRSIVDVASAASPDGRCNAGAKPASSPGDERQDAEYPETVDGIGVLARQHVQGPALLHLGHAFPCRETGPRSDLLSGAWGSSILTVYDHQSSGTMTGNIGDERGATLEDLRRARGEGWEWPRIQTDPCPQCGDHPGTLPPGSLGDRAVELAADMEDLSRGSRRDLSAHEPRTGDLLADAVRRPCA